jgi:hypothetical protein
MASGTVQHMQKALEQMPLKLPEGGSKITGKTGMTIIRAILAGERAPVYPGAPMALKPEQPSEL